MKKITRLIILFFVFQMTACSHFYASRDNLNDRISEWLSNNEYAAIESALQHLSKDHPEYKKIKARNNTIISKKNSFINTSINTADKLVAQEKWQQALDVYIKAIDKVGENKKLASKKEQLINERDTQVSELRKNMLLRRARALVQYKPIYEKLHKLIPDDYRARYDINKYQKEKEEITQELDNCGEYAMSKKNDALAEECYDLSNQLIPDDDKQLAINRIRTKKKSIDTKRKSSELIEAYQNAYNSGDFPTARFHLDKLITLDESNNRAKELKAQLDRDINKKVETGITQGKRLYSEGNIDQALKIWHDLLKIDPKNEELAALVSRGEKVSEKIKTLEKSSTN